MSFVFKMIKYVVVYPTVAVVALNVVFAVFWPKDQVKIADCIATHGEQYCDIFGNVKDKEAIDARNAARAAQDKADYAALGTGILAKSRAFDKAAQEQKANAHTQYIKANNHGHAGNRSSYLTRAGVTKGDDYNNCVRNEYWKSNKYGNLDAHDFCAWHAEIGKWQYRG